MALIKVGRLILNSETILGQELGLGSCWSFESGKFDVVRFAEHIAK